MRERGVGFRVVAAEMRAAALFAHQRGGGDQLGGGEHVAEARGRRGASCRGSRSCRARRRSEASSRMTPAFGGHGAAERLHALRIGAMRAAGAQKCRACSGSAEGSALGDVVARRGRRTRPPRAANWRQAGSRHARRSRRPRRRPRGLRSWCARSRRCRRRPCGSARQAQPGSARCADRCRPPGRPRRRWESARRNSRPSLRQSRKAPRPLITSR